MDEFDDDKDNDDNHDYSPRWMFRRHCALKCTDPDVTMKEEMPKASSHPNKSPNDVSMTGTPTTTIVPTSSHQKKTSDSSSSTVTKNTLSTDSTSAAVVSGRHETSEENTILERTPVHREETDEFATISMDVSGFALSQLNVRLEEEEQMTTTGQSNRPILTVDGERTNLLGDKFQIHRRFLLDRDNLADGNLQDLAISANLSKEGILTIRVPKKEKGKMEKEAEKVSRTIPVQQQQLLQQQQQDTHSEEQSNETKSNEQDEN
jgi:HSP20 family molecular chaperone IbpA